MITQGVNYSKQYLYIWVLVLFRLVTREAHKDNKY